MACSSLCGDCTSWFHGLMAFRALIAGITALCCVVSVSGQDAPAVEVYYTRIDELPRDVVVGNVVRDANLDTRYEASVLESFVLEIIGGQHMDYFYMDPDHVGNLKTAKFLDRDWVCQNAEDCDISLDVAIVRPATYFQVIKVTLTLLDNNDNSPEFSEPEETIYISENALPPVSFVLPTATDPDSLIYSIKRYAFTRRSTKFDLELIQNIDGTQDLRLRLLERLNREEQSSYSLQVEATDGGLPAKVGLLDVQIIVADANDNTPEFQRSVYNVSIREDHRTESPFLKVMASDPDAGPNGQVVYSLAQQAMDTFSIDSQTGELSLVKELDYETQTSYHMLVTARDQGPDSVPVHVRVVINVEDVNDFVPEVSVNAWTESGQIEVTENEVGSFVAHVSVTDEDRGPSGQVTCHVTDTRFTLRLMDGNTYKMVTTAMLDREESDVMRVRVECEDGGSPTLSDSEEVVIHVLDQNDHRPEFSEPIYTASVTETSDIGTAVITVTATDGDIGPNAQITYHLHANSNNVLRVDSSTGAVTTNSLLDHETLDHLDFYLLAIDHGKPAFTSTATISMAITDMNDEKPVFAQTAYNFGTFENQLPGTEIGTIQAKDGDAAPNDVFIFTLSDNSTFSVDPTNGIISTNKVLDREYQAAYYLYVQATDIEPPYLSSTVSLTIYVADRNDNAPRISFPTDHNNTVEISSFVSPGYAITRVVATDADLGNNARLEYSIGKGDTDGMFTLDPLSGVFTVQGDLSASMTDRYQLLVIVRDHGQDDEQKSAMATLHVIVNRTVDFATAASLAPPVVPETSEGLGYHEKILIIIGATTLVVVSLLVVAIICIKRRQGNQQERDSYKYMCRVDVPNALKQNAKSDLHQSHDKMSVTSSNMDTDRKVQFNMDNSSHPTTPLSFSAAMGYPPGMDFIDKVSSVTSSPTTEPPAYPGVRGVTSDCSSTLDLPTYPSSTCPLHGHKLATFQRPPQNQQHTKVPPPSPDKRDPHDSDSTSGCSADMSNSDSGRGPSEEGDPNAPRYHGNSLSRKTLAPNLPPRTSSLGRKRHNQTGCHGYTNGSHDNNLSDPHSNSSKPLSKVRKHDPLGRNPGFRNVTVNYSQQKPGEGRGVYSQKPVYANTDKPVYKHAGEKSPADAINV